MTQRADSHTKDSLGDAIVDGPNTASASISPQPVETAGNASNNSATDEPVPDETHLTDDAVGERRPPNVAVEDGQLET